MVESSWAHRNPSVIPPVTPVGPLDFIPSNLGGVLLNAVAPGSSIIVPFVQSLAPVAKNTPAEQLFTASKLTSGVAETLAEAVVPVALGSSLADSTPPTPTSTGVQ